MGLLSNPLKSGQARGAGPWRSSKNLFFYAALLAFLAAGHTHIARSRRAGAIFFLELEDMRSGSSRFGHRRADSLGHPHYSQSRQHDDGQQHAAASRQPMPRHGPLKGDDPQRGVVGSSPAGAAVPSTQYGSGLTLRGYGLRYYFATFSLRTTPRAATRRPDMREKGRPHDAVSPSPTLARRCAPIAPPGWLFSTSAAVSSLRAAHSHSRALKMW